MLAMAGLMFSDLLSAYLAISCCIYRSDSPHRRRVMPVPRAACCFYPPWTGRLNWTKWIKGVYRWQQGGYSNPMKCRKLREKRVIDCSTFNPLNSTRTLPFLLRNQIVGLCGSLGRRKRHLNVFISFCTAHSRDQHTDRRTTLHHQLSSNSAYLCWKCNTS